MPNRTYTEEEVIQLLKRAAEIEAARQSPSGEKSGLTLDEIVAMAAEAGLDPEFLEQAADELALSGHASEGREAMVEGSEIYTERWVRGTLNDDMIDTLVSELRHHHDSTNPNYQMYGMYYNYGKSNVQMYGKNMEWQHIDRMGIYETKVLVQPRGEKIRTRVSIRSSMGNWTGSPWLTALFGASVGAGAGAIAMATSGGAVLVGLITAITAMGLSSVWLDRYTKKSLEKYKKQVQSLADSVVRNLSDSLSRKGRSAQRARVPLDDAFDEESDGLQPGQKRSRNRN